MERFYLEHYLLPQYAELRDVCTDEVLLVLYQALKAAEDATPESCLLTTIQSYHDKLRFLPVAILTGLLAELGLSDRTLMDTLEEALHSIAPTPNEALGTFLWRTQVALADYNKTAPKHGLLPYSKWRLFLKLHPFLPANIRDLLLPCADKEFFPRLFDFAALFRVLSLHDRIRSNWMPRARFCPCY